jgi:hypothetical protein
MGSCGLDDVEDGLSGDGATVFVSDQPFVVCPRDDAVRAVGRQGGQLVLRGQVLGVTADAGGQDDQRLGGEVPQGCGFLRRGIEAYS